jgi:ubiquitin-conjugating enzyme E2 Z
MSQKKVVISKECISRLLKDVKELIRNPLDENGIYYNHDDTDMLKGRAMIVGQNDTPYYGGYYFFELNFSPQYPFSPPKVIFLTNGDNIRFNPNLYVNGKVCISILNTWAGEQWSSCQTIKTLLLTMSTLLCKDPLLNEPGITSSHKDFHTYTKIVEFKNIDVALIKMLQKHPSYFPIEFGCFYDAMKNEFLKNKEGLLKSLEDKIIEFPQATKFKIQLYKMDADINYSQLLANFKTL